MNMFRFFSILFLVSLLTGESQAARKRRDSAPPSVSISSQPAPYTKQASVSFSFSATDIGTGIKSILCQMDTATYVPCTSPIGYSGLGEGVHVFNVKATDYANNVSTVSAKFYIDRTAPLLAFSSTPPLSSTNMSASFAFSISDATPISSTSCALDGAVMSACVSPVGVQSLTVGSHLFSVQATDSANNIGKIDFTFVVEEIRSPASDPAQITAVRLVNNDLAGVVITNISEGMTIDLSKMPTMNLNIEVLVSSINGISKVNFGLDGYSHTESSAPYALCGDWTACPSPSILTTVGSHTLTLTPYDSNGLIGMAKVVHFSVISGTVSPPPPAVNTFASLSWDANIEPDLSGYKIYYGKIPGVYGNPINVGPSSAPTYQIDNLERGYRYYFAVKAISSSGLESDYSMEVFKDIPLQ